MDEGTWISDIDQGISIDNIMPTVPSDLFASFTNGNVELNWSEPIDYDFQYFSIYRNDSLLGFTIESNYIDETDNLTYEESYSITATDSNENESLHSEYVTMAYLDQGEFVDTYDPEESVDPDPIVFEDATIDINIPADGLDIEEGTEITITIESEFTGVLQQEIDQFLPEDSDVVVEQGYTFEATDEDGNQIELSEGTDFYIEIIFDAAREDYSIGYLSENNLENIGADCSQNEDTVTCIGDGPGFGTYLVYSGSFGYQLLYNLATGNTLLSLPGINPSINGEISIDDLSLLRGFWKQPLHEIISFMNSQRS